MGGFTTTNPDASSAAETARASMDAWTPAERDSYFLTGKLPETEAASSTAKTETTETAGEPAGETGTGSDPGPKQDAKSGSDAERRIKGLLAEIKELKAKAAPAPSNDSAAAAAGESKSEKKEQPKELVAPVQPKSGDFKGEDAWEQYEAARDKYLADLLVYARALALQDFRAEQETRETKRAEQARVDQINQELTKSWVDRVKAVHAKYADAADVMTDQVPVNNAADGYILKSPVGAELFYHLAKNPAEAQRIFALDAFDTVEALIELKGKLGGSSKTIAPSKKVTSAPPTETVLDGRATAPADPRGAAIAAGDFARFAELENARELASRK